MKSFPILVFSVFLVAAQAASSAHLPYQKLEPEITRIVEAESFPSIRLSPSKAHLLKVYYDVMPPLHFIAAPKKRLAGLRFRISNRSKYRSYFYTRIESLDLKTKKVRRYRFPKGSQLGSPVWSPDSKAFAVTRTLEDCVELWVARLGKKRPKRVEGVCLNTVFGGSVRWIDGERLLLRTADPSAPVPDEHFVAKGPVIFETGKKVSQNRTYQDMIRTENDAAVFKAVATSRLAVADLKKDTLRKIGPEGVISSFSLSPDDSAILVRRIEEPYSRVVPYYRFPAEVEVWDLTGKVRGTLASLPAFEAVPIHGVPTGPRSFSWVPEEPSTLFYIEALDRGDWKVKVPHREQIYLREIRGKKILPPREFLKLEHRIAEVQWLQGRKEILISDYERDREWIQTYRSPYPSAEPKLLWSYGYKDDYNKPGDFVRVRNAQGRWVVAVVEEEGGPWVFTSDKGATPEGDRPYLKKVSLSGGKEKELFRSKKGTYESFLGFADLGLRTFLTKRQSAKIPPDVYRLSLDGAPEVRLTKEPNPAEVFSKVRKEMLTWKREDGTLMSGVLYYPLGYEKGKKYPTIVSAYPVEYTNKKTAGQVRGSSDKYSRPYKASYLYFALRGYAVLYRAQMPVVGHPESMNDTLIEQLDMNARAIRKVLVDKGITDPERMGIIGHSYGAFMVANLLTHSDVFKTGIARSGAFNRSLTPFGFQSERRPFWKAKDTYLKVSPFFSAEKMKRPVLLIHGAIDNNSGTHTMQSERYFAALKGNGVQARLVLLPHESHGYSAIDSVNHVLWEMNRWFDQEL